MTARRSIEEFSLAGESAPGVSLWRRVSDAIVRDIRGGAVEPGGKLPAEATLAQRLGVARPTVRRALLHLQELGFIKSVHGRGTYVAKALFEYRIAAQKSFEENLVDSARMPSRQLISATTLPATAVVAENLEIAASEPVRRLVTLGIADDTPVVLGTIFMSPRRLPGIDAAIDKARLVPSARLSFAGILRDAGIGAYLRRYIRLNARPPTTEERAHLRLEPGEYVVQTESVSTDESGLPLFYSVMGYSSARASFYVGPEAFARSSG
jgi:GntR family transcriptional regulator, phosphonate transport system regulatory protein